MPSLYIETVSQNHGKAIALNSNRGKNPIATGEMLLAVFCEEDTDAETVAEIGTSVISLTMEERNFAIVQINLGPSAYIELTLRAGDDADKATLKIGQITFILAYK